MTKKIIILSTIIILIVTFYSYSSRNFSLNTTFKFGDAIDSLHRVKVFYNGSVGNVSGRSFGKNNYNIGLKYQCVEFVKRYYYEHLNHEMPNSYGHAKDFFNVNVKDGEVNLDRNLLQYSNGSNATPRVKDLIIFDATLTNPFGHVAIISKVGESNIEIIQENLGNQEHFLTLGKKNQNGL